MLALYHLSFCDLPLLCLFAKKVLYTKFPHYEEIKQNFLCSNLAAPVVIDNYNYYLCTPNNIMMRYTTITRCDKNIRPVPEK